MVATASVASGVTSRRAGPVPPVVSTRSHPQISTSSISVSEMRAGSSGIRRSTACQGEVIADPSHSRSAGRPRSWYVPEEARSETDTRPMIRSSGWRRAIRVVAVMAKA
ncbi:hypothetical protein D3C72_1301400 [compost metagenome]